MKFFSLENSVFDSEVKTLLIALQKNFTIKGIWQDWSWLGFFILLDVKM